MRFTVHHMLSAGCRCGSGQRASLPGACRCHVSPCPAASCHASCVAPPRLAPPRLAPSRLAPPRLASPRPRLAGREAGLRLAERGPAALCSRPHADVRSRSRVGAGRDMCATKVPPISHHRRRPASVQPASRAVATRCSSEAGGMCAVLTTNSSALRTGPHSIWYFIQRSGSLRNPCSRLRFDASGATGRELSKSRPRAARAETLRRQASVAKTCHEAISLVQR